MTQRARLAVLFLTGFLALCSLLVAAPQIDARSAGGVFAMAGSRATDNITYLEMRETTSLRADGGGEERIEFLIRNDGNSAVSSESFLFRVGSTQYWGIDAFDEQGSIGHTIVVEGNEVHVSLHFRQPVAPGAQYRYTFVINFPDLAEQNSGSWELAWGTYFTVGDFTRTVYLPGGGELTYASPPPDEQTDDFIRWRRYDMTAFELRVRYTLRDLSDQELAEEFAPSFRIHPEDIYVPMSVELALQHAECYPRSGGQKQQCTLALLAGDWFYAADSYIDFQGYPGDGLGGVNGSQQYYQAHIRTHADASPVVYARIWRGGGRTVIQYWLYYYYNSWGWQGGLRTGLHEGDWEMAQVVLDDQEAPLYAVFAQHFGLEPTSFDGASKKEWDDLPRDTVDGDHPIVYVARGSHASYFGPYPYLHDLDRTAPESQALVRPKVVYLLRPDGADLWVGYHGKWGQPGWRLAFQGGPPSPGRQGQKWDSPLTWAQERVNWDEYAGHHLGKVRAHVTAPCNVGVRIVDTGKRFGWVFNEFRDEIAGGEYVVNETNGTRSLILHNTYGHSVWLGTIYTTCPNADTPSIRQTEERELSVEFYNDALGELATARYTLPAGWSPETTIGAIELSDPALALVIDRDSDGTADMVLPPDEVTTEPLEPPAGQGAMLYFPSVLR